MSKRKTESGEDANSKEYNTKEEEDFFDDLGSNFFDDDFVNTSPRKSPRPTFEELPHNSKVGSVDLDLSELDSFPLFGSPSPRSPRPTFEEWAYNAQPKEDTPRTEYKKIGNLIKESEEFKPEDYAIYKSLDDADTALFKRGPQSDPGYIDKLRKQSISDRIKLTEELKSHTHIIDEYKIDEPVLVKNHDWECYIIITCHGAIDISKKIWVPYERTIIKKNITACGYPNMTSYNDFIYKDNYKQLFNYLRDDINLCGGTEETAREHYMKCRNPNTDGHCIPNIYNDPHSKFCHVMENKLQYYNKTYVLDAEDQMNMYQFRFNGITFFIGNTRAPYETFKKYNIMIKQDLEALLQHPIIIEYNGLEEHRKSRLWLFIRMAELHGTGPYPEDIIYNKIDTKFIFDLLYLIPIKKFTILDTSCQVVPSGIHGVDETDPARHVHPSNIHYDYSPHNPIGFGGSSRGRSFKSRYKYSKKQNKKRMTYKKTYKKIKSSKKYMTKKY